MGIGIRWNYGLPTFITLLYTVGGIDVHGIACVAYLHMLFITQKDLLAILISQSDIRESSIESSVYKAVQENDETMKAIQE